MFSISRFGELLQNFPKTTFNQAVQQHQADRYCKSFKSWQMLTLLLYGQLQQSQSLRQLISGFNTHSNHHYHLNAVKARRSTVSDAMQKRSVEPFKAVCEALMASVTRRQRRAIEGFVCIIDSSPISLRDPRRHQWAESHRTPSTKGLKLHLAIEAHQQAPIYANITHANVNDLSDAREMTLMPETTYVFDKGYCDYNWWHKINENHSLFVTRLKYNARHSVIEELDTEGDDILSDQVIHLTNKRPGGGRVNHYANKDLRMIQVTRDGKENPLILITNDFDRSAKEISDLYRQRWDIELFFKWVKQKLKIKRFWGDSENAIRIQIYVALIGYLLMILLKERSNYKDSLSELAIELKTGLFCRTETEYQYYRRRRREVELAQSRQIGLWA